METSRRSTLSEFWVATLLFTIVSIASKYAQKITLIRYWDSDEYYWMTYTMAMHQPIRASAPWVYRVLVPWLASVPSRVLLTRGYPYYVLAYPYYAINVAAAFITTILLIVWLRRFVESRVIRLIIVALFLAEWHGPARFVYFYPMYVDPPFIAFLLGGLMLIERGREDAPGSISPLLTAVCVLGTLCRESMILIPLTFIVAHNPFATRPGASHWRRDFAALCAPLVGSFVALAFAHAVVAPKFAYATSEGAAAMLKQKPIFTWVLAWFITFGPAVIAVICCDARRTLRFLRDRPHLLFYLGACAVLSFFGGTDTERVLFWALPVVYVLAARAAEQHRAVLTNVALLTVLGLSQAISERVFWPIPDVLTSPTALRDIASIGGRLYSALNRALVIDDYYWNLWSFFGSRPWHALLLAYDVAFVAAIVGWTVRVSTRVSTATLAASETAAPIQTLHQ
jgi:hypothetical protein